MSVPGTFPEPSGSNVEGLNYCKLLDTSNAYKLKGFETINDKILQEMNARAKSIVEEQKDKSGNTTGAIAADVASASTPRRKGNHHRRFSSLHRQQFSRMDSIAGHYSMYKQGERRPGNTPTATPMSRQNSDSSGAALTSSRLAALSLSSSPSKSAETPKSANSFHFNRTERMPSGRKEPAATDLEGADEGKKLADKRQSALILASPSKRRRMDLNGRKLELMSYIPKPAFKLRTEQPRTASNKTGGNKTGGSAAKPAKPGSSGSTFYQPTQASVARHTRSVSDHSRPASGEVLAKVSPVRRVASSRIPVPTSTTPTKTAEEEEEALDKLMKLPPPPSAVPHTPVRKSASTVALRTRSSTANSSAGATSSNAGNSNASRVLHKSPSLQRLRETRPPWR